MAAAHEQVASGRTVGKVIVKGQKGRYFEVMYYFNLYQLRFKSSSHARTLALSLPSVRLLRGSGPPDMCFDKIVSAE
jgi:hypothetical protein